MGAIGEGEEDKEPPAPPDIPPPPSGVAVPPTPIAPPPPCPEEAVDKTKGVGEGRAVDRGDRVPPTPPPIAPLPILAEDAREGEGAAERVAA